MKKTMNRLCGLALACVVAVCGLVAAPVSAGAVSTQGRVSGITVNSTTIAFAGHEWYVIGYNDGMNAPSGVYTTNSKSATLLAKIDEFGNSAFRLGDTSLQPGYTQYQSNALYYIDNATPPNWVQPNEYLSSTLQLKMADIASGVPQKEQALIHPRSFSTGDQIAGPETPNQLMWPLSQDEWTTVGDSNVLKVTSGNDWSLRSPRDAHAHHVQIANPDGQGCRAADAMKADVYCRPALNLNLSGALFASDAAGGKSAVTAGSWSTAASLQTTDAIKLTQRDSSIVLNSATVTGVSSNTITFDYIANGTFNRLSAIVTDSTGETVKQYVALTDTPAAPGVTGSASVTVPGGLAATDKLRVFAEEVNADSAKMSDFASAEVQLTRAAPTGLAGTAPTTYGGTDGQITGTTAEMEYSADGTTWTSCTASPTSGLAAGSYRVRYKAMVNGIRAIDVAAATVTVGEGAPSAPTVADITAPLPVDEGGTLTLSVPGVAENGAPVTSQGWQISANGTDGWKAFGPATTMTAAHKGQYLRYFATNSVGTGYSNTVQITLNTPQDPRPVPNPPPPPTDPDNPADTTLTPGDNSPISLWTVLCLIAGIGIVGVIMWRRRMGRGA